MVWEKQVLSFFLFIIFIGGITITLVRQVFFIDKEEKIETRLMIFPDAQNFSDKTGIPLHYKAYKTDPGTGREQLLGVVVVTTDVAPEIRGYAGPIRIMVGMNTQGEISGISILSHSETPSYVVGLDEFINQFVSRNIAGGFKLGKDLDGITGATITCESIARSVEKSLKTAARLILRLEGPAEMQGERELPADQILIPLSLFIAAIFGVVFRNDFLRWSALLGSLLYLGFLKSVMLSVVQLVNVGFLKFPHWRDAPSWYLLMGLTLTTSFLLGMVYCGNICPFAAIQELLFNSFQRFCPPKIRIKGSPPARRIDRLSRHTKFALLFIILTASFLFNNAGLAFVEPFLTFFPRHGSKLKWGFLALILILSLFYFRFWCKYLCPIGAFNGILSNWSIFKIRLAGICTGCKICDRICPVGAIELNQHNQPAINYAECILCNKCVGKCPQASLRWRGPFNANKTR